MQNSWRYHAIHPVQMLHLIDFHAILGQPGQDRITDAARGAAITKSVKSKGIRLYRNNCFDTVVGTKQFIRGNPNTPVCQHGYGSCIAPRSAINASEVIVGQITKIVDSRWWCTACLDSLDTRNIMSSSMRTYAPDQCTNGKKRSCDFFISLSPLCLIKKSKNLKQT